MCYECAPICVAGIEARADNGVFFHQLVDLAVHQRRLTLLLCDGFGIRHGPLHKIRVHSDLDAVGMLSAIHFYTFAIIHTFPFGKRPGHPERYPARSFAIQLVACVVFLNTLLYPHGSARTGEGSAAVRGCELVCEFLIHRGFIGVGYDGGRNVSSIRKALGAEEARPQEQVGVGEEVWSLATDEEASVVDYRHGSCLANNSPPNRQPAP